MLPISKLPEPPRLRKYKSDHRAVASYDDFTRFKVEFLELRQQLLKEQKYICAYCGQEILSVENENGVAQIKTEHFNPQDKTAVNDLNYTNLLACCLGNQHAKGENYCDSKKGEDPLNYLKNPSAINVRDRDILYKVNLRQGKEGQGEVLVLSRNDSKDRELNEVLNLNHDYLKSRRFQKWKNEVQNKLGEDWTVSRVEEVRSAYVQLSNGCHKEFKDFILWYLDNWLQKTNR